MRGACVYMRACACVWLVSVCVVSAYVCANIHVHVGAHLCMYAHACMHACACVSACALLEFAMPCCGLSLAKDVNGFSNEY